MPIIQVMLEVAPHIAMGLASGHLERVGGVIREAGSKQVVAWLREGGKIASNTNLSGGFLKTLLDASSGGLASTVTGAVSTAVTARSHFLIMQQLQGLTSLVGIVGGVGMLNLAASIISAGIILKRMSAIEQAVINLGVGISQKFAQDRQVKMDTAINAANLAMSMEGEDNRSQQANQALTMLYAAQRQIWLEIDTLRGSPPTAQNNELMQKNIEQAMHLDTLYCRCLLELENVSLAKTYLDEKFQDYRETSRCLVHRHLGTQRAAYFHHSVQESDLLRYISIEHWLKADENRLIEILLANRSDFWNRDVADGSKINKPGKDHYINALTFSELLIENLGRMDGFALEIEATGRLGISYSEWERQQEEALAKAEVNLAEHDDYALLVDTEWLANQTDTAAA